MSQNRYHPALSLVHWLVAVLIIAALVMSAFVMSHIPANSPEKIEAIGRHMTAGLMVLVLTLFRFFIRKNTTRPAPALSGMDWADKIVPIVHRMLDIIVLVMLASGISMVVLTGLLPVVISGQGVIPKNLETNMAFTIHAVGAITLAGLLALHAGGALYHQFILRDGLISRIWFRVAKARG